MERLITTIALGVFSVSILSYLFPLGKRLFFNNSPFKKVMGVSLLVVLTTFMGNIMLNDAIPALNGIMLEIQKVIKI